MASITKLLDEIKHAVYGREVRDAIHDGIKQAYEDASKNGNANMEVSMARGDFNTLGNRLNSLDAILRMKAEQAFVDAQLAAIVSGAPKGTFSNLQALKDAYPDGEEGVFLVLSDGHWYYWNAETREWTDGGVYQGSEVQDGSVTTEKTDKDIFVKDYLDSDQHNLDYILEKGNYVVNEDVINTPEGKGGTLNVTRNKIKEERDNLWLDQMFNAFDGDVYFRKIMIKENTSDIIYIRNWRKVVSSGDIMINDFNKNGFFRGWLSEDSDDLNSLLDEGNYIVSQPVKNNPYEAGGALSVSRFKTSINSPGPVWVVQFFTCYGSQHNAKYRGRFAVRIVAYNENTGEINYKSDWSDKREEPLKILSISNSFGLNTTNYIHEIANSADVNIITGNLYISGGLLRDHYDNMKENNKAYRYDVKGSVDGSKTDTQTPNVSIDDALDMEDWDYVFFNQASAQSGVYDTFQPYLSDIIDHVKDKLPNIKIALMPTWAYSNNFDDTRFNKYDNDQLTMYKDIMNTYKESMSDVDFDLIIPVGTAIQNARTDDYMLNMDDELTRDGFHLGDTGMYIAGLTFLKTFFGNVKIDWRPSSVSKRAAYFANVAADNAVLNPFKVTEI